MKTTMNSDRDGRRNNRGRGRYNGRGSRGYKRGVARYYSQNYSWKQSKPHHQNQYAIPPQKPPSPLPGTEEYRQRHIQQTSELIKKQLNIDSDTCENSSVTVPLLNLISETIEPEQQQPSTSSAEPKKRTRRKRVEEIEDEDIDVQELYDKIIKHICSLSHSKKINLIQQGNAGYDIALQQIQKQKQLELSRALRDMSKRPTQADKDGDVINAIIPDIGIKLEDLPNSVIEELSKTLQVKFEDNGICSLSNEVSEELNDTIENIFDFEYLNKAQDDPELTESFNEGATDDFGNNSDFTLDDIDVSKSYLTPTNTVDNNFNDARSSDGYPVIRVKKDLFESRQSETVSEEKMLESTAEPPAQETSNIFSSQLQKNDTISDESNIFNKIFASRPKKSFVSPLDDVRYTHNSPLLRKLSNQQPQPQENLDTEISENIIPQEIPRQVTPPKGQEIPPKRWKSPGEKKMINYEHSIATSPNENAADAMSNIFQQMEEFNRCMSVVSEKHKKSGNGKHTKHKTVDPELDENGLESLQKSNEEIVDLDTTAEKEIAPELEQMICEEIPDVIPAKQLDEDQSLPGSDEVPMETSLEIPTDKTDSTKAQEGSQEPIPNTDLLNNESIKIDSTPTKDPIQNENLINCDSDIEQTKEIGTMTEFDYPLSSKKRKSFVEVKVGADIPTSITNIETQTPATFNMPKLKNTAMQTLQKQFRSAEVQAVQSLHTKISQTETSGAEIENFKTKCKSYSEAIKKLREIDNQIQNLIEQKSKIYESLKISPGKKSKKTESRNSGESSKSSPKRSKEDKKREEKPDTSKHKADHIPKKKKHKYVDVDEQEQNKRRKISAVSTPTPPIKKIDIEPKRTIKDEVPDTSAQPFKKPAIIESHPEKPVKPNKNDKLEAEPKKQAPFRERSRSKSKDGENLPTTSSSDDNVKYFDKEKRIKISKETEPLLVKDDKLFKEQCRVELLRYPVSALEDLKRSIKKSSNSNAGKVTGKEDAVDSSVMDKDGESSNHSSEGITTMPTTPSVTNNSDSGKRRVGGNSKVIDKTEFKGISGTIFALESSEDIVLAAGDNGVLYFFKILSKELLIELNLSTKALTSLFISRNNEECLIYVGSLDEQLRVIDLNSRQVLRTINVESGIQCIDVRWGYVFMGSVTGEILIYDTKKLKLEKPIKIYENRIYAIKATQEGARRVLLTSTKDSEVSVRDAMTGLLLRTMQSQMTAAPTVYTILLDQNLVYCASSQHDVLVYSFQNGDLANRYESLARRRVVCMQIVGNLIYVGCFNGTVCVFHKSTHRYLGQMIRRGELLISMLIVKNKVIVGTKNNKLVSWDIPNTYLERDG